MKKIIILIPFLCFYANAQVNEMKPIFNKKNLDGWNSFLPSHGVNTDPDSVFTVENGILQISGEEFGYISTKDTYKDFHLISEFKWGEAKYAPRINEKRDSGILYFVPVDIPEVVWPKSVEFQIQEGDTGDFWLIDSATIEVNGKRTAPADYLRVEKSSDNENPHGEWNSIEIISSGGKLTHVVNGQVVNKGSSPNIKEGRILIQSEGAEIYYRKIEIKRL